MYGLFIVDLAAEAVYTNAYAAKVSPASELTVKCHRQGDAWERQNTMEED